MNVDRVSCLVALWFVVAGADAAHAQTSNVQTDKATGIQYDAPRKLAVLSDKAISESSGLAACRSRPDTFWTHNDSGNGPRLFLFDKHGKTVAEFRLDLKKTDDWEDMCSFRYQGINYLLIGDVGDNGRNRKECWLHLLHEPQIKPDKNKKPLQLEIERSVRFTYEDGPRDCEALGVDATTGVAYLISKKLFGSAVYELPLFSELSPERQTARQTARFVATVNIPLASAADISPDGTRAVVLTYTDAFEFVRKPSESWSAAFQRPPRQLAMPIRRQGETICYGTDSQTLYLTSEHASQPFWEVPPKR